MINRLHLTVIIAIAVGSIAISRLIAGETVSLGWFTSIVIAVAVNMAALTAFNLWAWRWGVWQGWFVKRPHLWGDWDVIIQSHWQEPGTGNRPDPIAARFSIRQTYAAIHIRLKTPESKGDLIAATITDNGDGRYKILGVYCNEPSLEARSRSQIHNGAFILEVEGDPNNPTALKGHYWTDRLTKGEMVSKRRSTKLAHTIRCEAR